MRRRAHSLMRGAFHSHSHSSAFSPIYGHTFGRHLPALKQKPSKSVILARNNAKSSSIDTTVHVGTTYEHLCLRMLYRLCFSLTRTGGKSDKGIDLLGFWEPPARASIEVPLRVIVQCKAYAGQVYPALIRELEGAVAGAPGEWRNENTIGVLCSPRGATGGIRDAMRMAKRGIIWVTIEDTSGSKASLPQGKVTQLFWNDRVKEWLKDELGAGLKYVPAAKGLQQEVVLMVNGKSWEPKFTIKDYDRS